MNHRTRMGFTSMTGARLMVALAIISTAPVMPSLAAGAAASDERLANLPKSEYRLRRQRLMEQVKDGVIVLVGARQEDFGEVGRFRQKNDFMYLTGVQTPAAYLLLVPAPVSPTKSAQEVIFLPARNRMHEQWTGAQLGPGAEAEQAFGVTEVAAADKFHDRLRDLLKGPAEAASPLKLYTIVPAGPTAPLTRENLFIETMRRNSPQVQVTDVSPLIAEMRKVKSPAELALLQKAIDITAEAQRDAALAIRPGAYEYEVQAALEYAFARNGAERPGFPSIVGSGFYSTILHYNENRKRIEAGDTIVIDVGAEYSYYTADITRTYPATGKFTPRQREIYQLVLDAQRACEKAFKPGQMTMNDLNRVAREVMKASPLRDKQGNTLERYFIHGLGHWLGMDVHDVGNYAKPMPPGSVITIEPGIYIPEERLGVRIEDDYLVTDKGLIKLSAKIPSEPDEVEKLMSSRPAAGSK